MLREKAIEWYGPPDHTCKCGTGCGRRPKGDNSCFVPGHDRRFEVTHWDRLYPR